MANLTVSFNTDIVPAGGFRLFYRPKGSSLPYTQHGVNFFVSPAVVNGIVDQDYEGYLEGDSGDGYFCPKLNFLTTKYTCVDIDDFDLDSSVADEIKVLFPIVFGVVPQVNQVVNVTCKDLVTDTVIGTISVIVAPDGTKVSPAGDVKFTGLINGRNYRITLTNNCDADFATSQDIAAGAGALKEWVEDTTVCEQDAVFTLDNEVTGFSSPRILYYHQPSGRVYVGDLDDAAGNVYYFNPNTFGAIGDITRPTFPVGIYYNVVVDSVYRRLYFTGQNSGGLRVFFMDDHSNVLVPYGADGTAFNRITISLLDTRILVIDRSVGTITTIDRATLATISTVSLGTIPSGTSYLPDSSIYQVNNELWVCSDFRPVGNIGRYDLNLTTLLGSIVLPGIAAESSSRFRQIHYYDAANDRFYLSDGGSSQWFVINGTTTAIEAMATITNRQGKLMAIGNWVSDPITGDLFFNASMYDGPADGAKLYRIYKQDRTTFDFTTIYPNESFAVLGHQVGTNKLWGTFAGEVQWSGIGGWNTDGKIIKYSR